MRIPAIVGIGMLTLAGCAGPRVEVLEPVVYQGYMCNVTASYRSIEDRRFDTPVLYVAARGLDRNQANFDAVTGYYDIGSKKIDIVRTQPRIVDESEESDARKVVKNCAAAATKGTRFDINKINNEVQ